MQGIIDHDQREGGLVRQAVLRAMVGVVQADVVQVSLRDALPCNAAGGTHSRGTTDHTW
jgi:hypothetical protein